MGSIITFRCFEQNLIYFQSLLYHKINTKTMPPTTKQKLNGLSPWKTHSSVSDEEQNDDIFSKQRVEHIHQLALNTTKKLRQLKSLEPIPIQHSTRQTLHGKMILSKPTTKSSQRQLEPLSENKNHYSYSGKLPSYDFSSTSRNVTQNV